jgi:hypothetical protein
VSTSGVKCRRRNIKICFLQESFPDHAILGEETSTTEELERVDAALAESDWTWIVDPIDGTLNFVRCLDVALIWCSLKFSCTLYLCLVHIVPEPRSCELLLWKEIQAVHVEYPPVRNER